MAWIILRILRISSLKHSKVTNCEHTLSGWFFESLVLIAVAKFIRELTEGPSKTPLDEAPLPSDAIETLLNDFVRPNSLKDEPLCQEDPDEFRHDALYNETVEDALAPHLGTLKELYWKITDVSATKKAMMMDDWLRLCENCGFFDEVLQ